MKFYDCIETTWVNNNNSSIGRTFHCLQSVSHICRPFRRKKYPKVSGFILILQWGIKAESQTGCDIILPWALKKIKIAGAEEGGFKLLPPPWTQSEWNDSTPAICNDRKALTGNKNLWFWVQCQDSAPVPWIYAEFNFSQVSQRFKIWKLSSMPANLP